MRHFIPRSILSSTLLAGVLVFAAGCGSKISKENYDKIQTGMSKADVEAILGSGTASSGGGVGGLTGTSVDYKDSNGHTITIVYLNDKVQLKSEQGL